MILDIVPRNIGIIVLILAALMLIAAISSLVFYLKRKMVINLITAILLIILSIGTCYLGLGLPRIRAGATDVEMAKNLLESLEDYEISPSNFTGKWGYINTKGEKVTDYKYDYASNYYNQFAIVGKIVGYENKEAIYKYAYINNKGKLITGFDFYEVSAFDGPLAAVKTFRQESTLVYEPKYEYINKQGKMVWRIIDRH